MAQATDVNYNQKINNLMSQIIQAAFETGGELRSFFKKIVEIGANITNASSCCIFLLEESATEEGQKLSLYEHSGNQGKILMEQKATYYIPKRDSFKEQGFGKRKIREFCNKKEIDLEHNPERKSFMEILEERGINYNAEVENGNLPMGLTAFVFRDKKEPKACRFNNPEIFDHPEWRGSYEGAHGRCESIVCVPLIAVNRHSIGLIKIENKKGTNCDSLDRVPSTFSNEDMNIMEKLSEAATLAINNYQNRDDTYKKIIGIKILNYILELKINESDNFENLQIYNRLKKFYEPMKYTIEDKVGIDAINQDVSILLNDIASYLKLNVSNIILEIGEGFEHLLGTNAQYREHFLHQFQVFLLGYYIINLSSEFREILKDYLKIKERQDFLEILQIWYLTSIFHDFAYSLSSIDEWMKSYFGRIQVKPLFSILWTDIQSDCREAQRGIAKAVADKFNLDYGEIFDNLSDSFALKHDHGVISGILLRKVCKRIPPNVLNESVLAIVLHTFTLNNFEGAETKLNLKNSPFAFLLIYCDNVQQYGRIQIYSGISENVKLQKINYLNDNGVNKLLVDLMYLQVTGEQSRMIKKHISEPLGIWYTPSCLQFGISINVKRDRSIKNILTAWHFLFE